MAFYEFLLAICHKLIYSYYSTFTKKEEHNGRSIDKSGVRISVSENRIL